MIFADFAVKLFKEAVMQVKASSGHEAIFIALVVLVLSMVGLSQAHLPGALHNTAIFLVAGIMSVLVAMRYMGLRIEGKLVWTMVLVSLLLFAILCVVLIPDLVWRLNLPGQAAPPPIEGH